MFTKETKAKKKDLVLIQTEELNEKCGECNSKLILETYWTKDGYHQNIKCEKCGTSIWRQLGKQK